MPGIAMSSQGLHALLDGWTVAVSRVALIAQVVRTARRLGVLGAGLRFRQSFAAAAISALTVLRLIPGVLNRLCIASSVGLLTAAQLAHGPLP